MANQSCQPLDTTWASVLNSLRRILVIVLLCQLSGSTVCPISQIHPNNLGTQARGRGLSFLGWEIKYCKNSDSMSIKNGATI